MKKVYLLSLFTCIMTLSCIYAPEVKADKEETKRDLKNEYTILYDISNNERVIDKNNNQVAFMLNETDGCVEEKLTNDDIVNCANKFANKIIDVSKYIMENCIYYEEMQYYTITYYKYKDGYKTQDFCFVDVDNYGNILAYAAMNQGSFDEIELSFINRDNIEKYVHSNIERLYGNDILEWSIADIIAVLDENGKVQMMISVDIEFIDETFYSETLFWEVKQE